jgi:hypothetical protein
MFCFIELIMSTIDLYISYIIDINDINGSNTS